MTILWLSRKIGGGEMGQIYVQRILYRNRTAAHAALAGLTPWLNLRTFVVPSQRCCCSCYMTWHGYNEACVTRFIYPHRRRTPPCLDAIVCDVMSHPFRVKCHGGRVSYLCAPHLHIGLSVRFCLIGSVIPFRIFVRVKKMIMILIMTAACRVAVLDFGIISFWCCNYADAPACNRARSDHSISTRVEGQQIGLRRLFARCYAYVLEIMRYIFA